jgi:hypothetical protein
MGVSSRFAELVGCETPPEFRQTLVVAQAVREAEDDLRAGQELMSV